MVVNAILITSWVGTPAADPFENTQGRLVGAMQTVPVVQPRHRAQSCRRPSRSILGRWIDVAELGTERGERRRGDLRESGSVLAPSRQTGRWAGR